MLKRTPTPMLSWHKHNLMQRPWMSVIVPSWAATSHSPA
jgi:hypothetical protein